MFQLPPVSWLVVLLLASVLACSEGAPGYESPSPPPPATTSNNDVTASPTGPAKPSAPLPPTCTGKTGEVGDGEIEIASSGIDRVATVHVPAHHDGVKSLPLVLVLHPLLLTRKEMRKLTKVERFADDTEHGFIAVFPDGIGRSWNAGECCGKAKDQKLDDVGFMADLIAHVSTKWCIDPSRIYAMGFSNGAFLSYRLACELPGGLRAIAPVAGTLGIPEADCKPPHPTAVLAMHGTLDELVPFTGGPPNIPRGTSFGTFASTAATDAFWATKNGCKPAGEPYYTKGEVSCVRHEGCQKSREGDAEATVGLCTVTGGGHQWPGGSALIAMGHVTTDLDATEAAIELFKAHGL